MNDGLPANRLLRDRLDRAHGMILRHLDADNWLSACVWLQVYNELTLRQARLQVYNELTLRQAKGSGE